MSGRLTQFAQNALSASGGDKPNYSHITMTISEVHAKLLQELSEDLAIALRTVRLDMESRFKLNSMDDFIGN